MHLMLLPREAQEGKDEGDEAAFDEPSQDLLLLRRVGRVPGIRLAAKATDQDPLPVAEAVEAELAVVAPHPAVAHAAEGHVRVGEKGCRIRIGAKLDHHCKHYVLLFAAVHFHLGEFAGKQSLHVARWRSQASLLQGRSPQTPLAASCSW